VEEIATQYPFAPSLVMRQCLILAYCDTEQIFHFLVPFRVRSGPVVILLSEMQGKRYM
jgi:hypothetical protein